MSVQLTRSAVRYYNFQEEEGVEHKKYERFKKSCYTYIIIYSWLCKKGNKKIKRRNVKSVDIVYIFSYIKNNFFLKLCNDFRGV
jgi:hypothetical protein